MSAFPRCIAVFHLSGLRALLLAAVVAASLSPVRLSASVKTSPVLLLPGARPAATLPATDDALLEEIERASFRFFQEQSNPVTGLVRDRAKADGTADTGKASIASSGFALSAWTVAAHRGWVERSVALKQVRKTLDFLMTKAPRQKGFFYHFMEMDTGARAWKSEVSDIDSALFLAGAIVAREYFQDPEITRLVNELYRDMDWQWFLNGGKVVSLSWHPETGFSRYRWSAYSEHLMMSFLALGSPTHPLDADYWRTWERIPTGDYAGYHYIQQPPLFIHQFTHAYVDFRGRRDAFADYFRNSVLATFAQRQFCIDLRTEFPSWSERLWGISASDSARGYQGSWGGPPRTLKADALDGTIVPYAAAGSLPFAPYETMLVLRHLRTVYGDKIWKRYGFVDAFNPQTGWVDSEVIGVDQGITLVQAENARTGMIWALFMQAPEVQLALRKAGLVSKSRDLSLDDARRLQILAAQAWQAVAAAPFVPSTAGLQITSIISAHALGTLTTDEAIARCRQMLAKATVPLDEAALAQYAASLVTLRQAIPALAGEATELLSAIDWNKVKLKDAQLGSASRLAAFFLVATNSRPTTVWTDLLRDTVKTGPIYVLAPAVALDQFVPGLWLDERAIITGASAAQLAYAAMIADSEHDMPATRDVAGTALLLDQLPAETVAKLEAHPPPPGWLAAATLAEQAAFLGTVANVLVPDCLRDWFQADPLVQNGRAALKEFGDAAFGQNNSLTARYELKGPQPPAPVRRALAVAEGTPREQWDWQRIADLSYKDSAADVLPDDPPLAMRFAYTWDATALHFHAEVLDTPKGYAVPADRHRFVELYFNPRNDGMAWIGPGDFQFYFRPDGFVHEWFHESPAQGQVTPNETGYVIEAAIPWKVLGLEPRPGLELGTSPAVMSEGLREWEAALKLIWCYHRRANQRVQL
ncbi:MAG: glucoamylase family protein, partial [Opitutales bacterium]